MVKLDIPQNVTDMSKSIDEMAKVTSQVLKDFLCEYCEVKGVKEKELNKYLLLERHSDGSITVKEGEVIIFRWSPLMIKEKGTEFSVVDSFFLLEKAKFPRTLAAIQGVKQMS